MYKSFHPMSCLSIWRRPFVVLLFLAALFAGSAAKAQNGTVSLDVTSAPLESVLRKIEQQTDYRFFYRDRKSVV